MTFDRAMVWSAALSLLCAPVQAAAHISLDQGGTHRSRYGDIELKAPPCGRLGGARHAPLRLRAGADHHRQPGRVVPHPSYFRIAFGRPAAMTSSRSRHRSTHRSHPRLPDGPGDHCGSSDYFNTSNVLMDDLDPHLAGAPGAKYTWTVKLPDMEVRPDAPCRSSR